MNALRTIFGGNSDRLTKEENHDARKYHWEFVRLTHRIGNGNDLKQMSNVIQERYGVRLHQANAFEGEYRRPSGKCIGNTVTDSSPQMYIPN